ncbi:hypothetical protein [Rubinisphaera sp.]|uniref:hypothetical protein n=1 Tax=Rubinisphaera sp. TaxID=2024857 RepID=UPI0025D74A98|nr:hypothetical protein [Rubinisphaera sp.]
MVFSRSGKRAAVHHYDLPAIVELATAERLFSHLETSGVDLDDFVNQAIDEKLRGAVA